MSEIHLGPEGEQTPSEDCSPSSQYPLKCLLSYHMDTNHIFELLPVSLSLFRSDTPYTAFGLDEVPTSMPTTFSRDVIHN